MYQFIAHSAKGTSWTKHKYIKKVNGRYYYPSTKSNRGAIKTSISNVASITGISSTVKSKEEAVSDPAQNAHQHYANKGKEIARYVFDAFEGSGSGYIKLMAKAGKKLCGIT